MLRLELHSMPPERMATAEDAGKTVSQQEKGSPLNTTPPPSSPPVPLHSLLTGSQPEKENPNMQRLQAQHPGV